MLGERCASLHVTARGGLGDRAWALREVATGRIASAKRFPRLLDFEARYETQPTLSAHGRIAITLPGGRVIEPTDPDAATMISEVLGHAVRLENQPRNDEKTGINRTTVFGDVPVSAMKPEWTTETMPDYFQLMTGTFFEIGAVYVLTSGSVDHLSNLQGKAARIDRRRFRPNIYIESDPALSGFVEDSWIGGALEIGDVVTVGDFAPTLWCVTSTLAQQDLPRDPSVLRTTAEHHQGCLGVYASVTRPGVLQQTDPVQLVNRLLPTG
jgi:hypothetical protein